jgi:hypothetical protein
MPSPTSPPITTLNIILSIPTPNLAWNFGR